MIVFDEGSLRRSLAGYFRLLSPSQKPPWARERLAGATPDSSARNGPVVAIPQVEGVGWTIFVWARIVVCITAFASGTGSVMQLKK